MSDTDATQARQNVVADVDEIIEHVINGNMLSMPYDVYVELFDAVDGLGVKLENLQSENDKLREWCSDFLKWADPPFALKSGTFDEYMTLVERAMKLGIEVDE